jgi:hypothetical protein
MIAVFLPKHLLPHQDLITIFSIPGCGTVPPVLDIIMAKETAITSQTVEAHTQYAF